MDYLQDFLDFCEYRRGLAQNTIRSYGLTLADYLGWLKERNISIESVKAMEIDAYLIHLRKDRENGVRTMNNRMYCLKMFYRYLQRIEAIDKNPLDLFQNTKEPKTLPKYLTPDQQEALISASKNANGHRTGSEWISMRDYLLILLLLDTGLRISEAVSVKLQDFDLNEGTLKVRGKGNKERIVILSNRVMAAIKEYLKLVDTLEFNGTVPPGICYRGFNLSKIVKDLGISLGSSFDAVHSNNPRLKALKKVQDYVEEKVKSAPIEFLFRNSGGAILGTRHAFRIIQGIGRGAGIKDLHPHMLRHSYATTLRRKGADLLLIKEALGHASVMTTEIYAHLGNEEYKTKLRELIN